MTAPRLVPAGKARNRLTHAQDKALVMAASHRFVGQGISRLVAVTYARFGRCDQVRDLEFEYPEPAKEGIRWADEWLSVAMTTANQTQMAPQSARNRPPGGVDG